MGQFYTMCCFIILYLFAEDFWLCLVAAEKSSCPWPANISSPSARCYQYLNGSKRVGLLDFGTVSGPNRQSPVCWIKLPLRLPQFHTNAPADAADHQIHWCSFFCSSCNKHRRRNESFRPDSLFKMQKAERDEMLLSFEQRIWLSFYRKQSIFWGGNGLRARIKESSPKAAAEMYLHFSFIFYTLLVFTFFFSVVFHLVILVRSFSHRVLYRVYPTTNLMIWSRARCFWTL